MMTISGGSEKGSLPNYTSITVNTHNNSPTISCSSSTSSSSGSASSSSSSASTSSSTTSTILKFSKANCNYCFRLHHKYGTYVRSSGVAAYCNTRILLPIAFVMLVMSLYWLSRGYMKAMLLWIEYQNGWIIFVIFICFFTVVSFPVIVGYLILIITSGYLFGLVRGIGTVVIGANLGAAIAHYTIRNLQHKLPIQRLLKNETGKAILRVISGPRSFKVVLLARLTPIPFGLQNTIFGVSNVHSKSYYLATLLGLLPAQLINVYIGSSLRSMHDVLQTHSTALASYGVFAVEICVGLVLMAWVLHKAKKELADHLLLEIDGDFKVIVEVQA